MRILFISILFVAYSAVYAQNELPTGQIEVVKDFEVRLTETKKIRIVPQPIPLDSTVRQYEYKLVASAPRVEYLAPELKPLAITREKKPQSYPLFVKAGYGSPNSLLGELSYKNVQDPIMYWGIDLAHLSANNEEIPLQKFSDTRGRINAGYMLNDETEVGGYIDGHFDKHYFYGADPIPSNPESLKRNFNRYDVFLKIAKVYSEHTSFSYNAFLQYLYDKDNLGSKESGLKVGGEVKSAFGVDQYPIGFSVMADLSKLEHTEEHKVNNVIVNPFAGYFLGDFKIHLGGKILLKKEDNEILPDLEVSYRLFENQLSLRAGWRGDVAKNNFRTLSTYNPYINTRLDSLNNMVSRRIFAGLAGAGEKLIYELSGFYTSFEGMAFFLQDEDAPEEFNPVYDDGSYFGLEGSIRFEILKHLTLRTQLYQRFYTLDHEAKPWHMPSFGLDGQITYTGGSDVYHISLIFHGENGLPYRTIGGTESNLEALVDLNLHADYFFSGSFGAFLEVNNILGNNRERWAGYPTYGFNIKGGIIYRLPE